VRLSLILVSQSLRVIIHLHTRRQDGFNVLMRREVKSWCLDAILWDDVSWNAYNACVQVDTLVTRGFWLIRLCTVYSGVYFVFCHFYFSIFISLLFVLLFSDFVDISSANPHKTLPVHLGELRSLKGLLYMPNTTVIPTKVSYILRLVFLLFCSRTSKR